MRLCPILLACLAACNVTAQVESGSTIKVHVVNSITGTPISGANIVLANEKEDQLYGRTDAGGGFTGRTHSAGPCLLTVTRKGYRMIAAGMMGKMIEVKSGAETEVTVQMRPLGILAGRVVDQYGDPVRDAIVRTEDKVDVPGENPYYQSYSVANSDDRGEYRIAEVEPGKHYVAAEYDSPDDNRRSRLRWPQTAGLILYPDATDIEHAQQVEVGAAETIRLSDLRLTIRRPITISGRIKPAPAGNLQPLSLQRADKLALHSPVMVQGGTSQADGSFKIDAWPGKYVLTASDSKSGKQSKPLALGVGEKDIAGLELELTLGYEIGGRIAVDGPEHLDFSKLLLNFGGPPVKIDPTGGFQANLFGGKGVYILQGLPEGWYIKNVVVAGRYLVGQHIEIEPGNADMTVTLSARGASVVISLDGTPSALAAVYLALLPESGEVLDPESIPTAQADGSGQFILKALPPGSYRVFTLSASNWPLLFSPGVLLEKYRNLAPLITLAEGEQKKLVIPVVKIPE